MGYMGWERVLMDTGKKLQRCVEQLRASGDILRASGDSLRAEAVSNAWWRWDFDRLVELGALTCEEAALACKAMHDERLYQRR
jgi:hypothetical protein